MSPETRPSLTGVAQATAMAEVWGQAYISDLGSHGDDDDEWLRLAASGAAASATRLPDNKLERARRRNPYWLRKFGIQPSAFGHGAEDAADASFAQHIAASQEEMGLTVDGIAGPATSAAFDVAPTPASPRPASETAASHDETARAAQPQPEPAAPPAANDGPEANDSPDASDGPAVEAAQAAPPIHAPVPHANDSVREGQLGDHVASMDNGAVDRAAAAVADLEARSAALSAAGETWCNEETGTDRDDLVSDIARARALIAGLDSAGLDPDELGTTKARLYRAVHNVAPYYHQYRNIDILQGFSKKQNKRVSRTCNVTSLAMVLESLGVSAASFTGSKEKLLAASGSKAYAPRVRKAKQQTNAGADDEYARLLGLRLPDFLQLAAVAEFANGTSPGQIKKGAVRAWKAVTRSPRHMCRIASRFGVSGEAHYFNSDPSQTEKPGRDYTTLTRFSETRRKPMEKLVDRHQNPDSQSDRQQERYARSRKQNRGALAGDGIENKLSIERYQRTIIEQVGPELDAGRGVMVNLHNHWTRLQSLSDDGFVVDDPGSFSRADRSIQWDEARAMGYFRKRIVFG